MDDEAARADDPDTSAEHATDSGDDSLVSQRLDHDEVDQVAALLFDADPAGINFGSNIDKYLTEAAIVVAALPLATGVDDVTNLLHRVFTMWFDADIAGPVEKYRPVAAEIWNAWRRRADDGPRHS